MRSATSKTSARLWLITTTPSPRSRSRLISVEHLRGLRDAERGGRLVEQHDLRLAEQRAGDRDRLALPAGQRRRPRVRTLGIVTASVCEQLGRPAAPSPPRRAGASAAPVRRTSSSRPRNRLATTSRLSHSARSW